MGTEQHYFDRVVATPRGFTRVRCHPRGGEFRDAAFLPLLRRHSWRNVLPGLVGLLGLVLHLTLHRRRWTVSAQPLLPQGGRESVWLATGRARAERTFAALLTHVQAERDLADFEPPS